MSMVNSWIQYLEDYFAVKGLNVGQVARQIGKSNNYLTRPMRGDYEMNAETVRLIYEHVTSDPADKQNLLSAWLAYQANKIDAGSAQSVSLLDIHQVNPLETLAPSMQQALNELIEALRDGDKDVFLILSGLSGILRELKHEEPQTLKVAEDNDTPYGNR